MASGTQQTRRRLKAREIRMLLYLLVLLGVVAWKFVPRPWHPAITREAPHYLIYSSATPAQTSDTAQMLGLLYIAYSNSFGSLDGFQRNPTKLKVKLFKDRAELRRTNPGLG
jgi:hypothetical protein